MAQHVPTPPSMLIMSTATRPTLPDIGSSVLMELHVLRQSASAALTSSAHSSALGSRRRLAMLPMQPAAPAGRDNLAASAARDNRHQLGSPPFHQHRVLALRRRLIVRRQPFLSLSVLFRSRLLPGKAVSLHLSKQSMCSRQMQRQNL